MSSPPAADAAPAGTPPPADEAARLAALRGIDIEALAGPELDRLTELTAAVLGAPTAFIGFVGADSQCFASKVNLDGLDEVPRELTFCTHTIARPERLLIVPDTSTDPRWAAHPMVTGGPRIAFYAGAALLIDSQPVGTLCVIDTKPHRLSPLQVQALVTLAEQAANHIRLQRVIADQRAADERFWLAFDRSDVGMMMTSLEPHRVGHLLRANEAMSRMVGYPPEQFATLPILDLLAGEERAVAAARLHAAMRGEVEEYATEVHLLARNGETVLAAVSGAVGHDAAGRPAYLLHHVTDITAQREQLHRLDDLAHHDELTGLANRVSLFEQLSRVAAHGDAGAWRVLVIDLDGFKAVNDTFGHSVGDAVLVEVGARLRALTRDGDLAARLGGDEFVIVARADAPGAEALASRVEAVLGEPYDACPSAALGGSVGFAPVQPGDTGDVTLRRADEAMYARKHARRA